MRGSNSNVSLTLEDKINIEMVPKAPGLEAFFLHFRLVSRRFRAFRP